MDTSMKFKVLKKEILHSGFIRLDARTLVHEKFSGSESPILVREVVDKQAAVAALIYQSDREEFILVRQFRAPLTDGSNPWLTELVAGHIDEGESPEMAVLREIEEEIGYRPETVNRICSFYTSPGYSNEEIILFSTEITESMKVNEGGGMDAEEEDILVQRFAKAEIKAMLENNEFHDAKTILALQHYFAHIGK